MMAVYLLHFCTPYKHARHYLGYTPGSVESRLKLHRNGRGARLMTVIREAGIDFKLARVWPDGNRAIERKLKASNHGPRYCPICKAEAKEKK